MEEKKDIQIHYDGSGDSAALYVDGKLVTVGDAYLAEERVFEMCGVEVVHSSNFMRGMHQWKDAAQTLDEIETYEQEREAALKEISELEAKAKKLKERYGRG